MGTSDRARNSLSKVSIPWLSGRERPTTIAAISSHCESPSRSRATAHRVTHSTLNGPSCELASDRRTALASAGSARMRSMFRAIVLPAHISVGSRRRDPSGFPGQANGELASLPKTGARPGHAAPVRFDEIANQCQPDAETRLRAWHCFIRLPEKIEQVRESLRRDTDPGVADANDGLTFPHVHPNRQLATCVSVLRGIGEQVYEHLLEAPRVGLQPHWCVRQCGSQPVIALFDVRPERLDCVAHDVA